MENNSLEKRYSSIIFVSVLIPVAVALLFMVKLKIFGINVAPLSFTPIYATINGLTAVVLVAGVVAKTGAKLHQRFMTTVALSLAF
jgi:putative membrane protein